MREKRAIVMIYNGGTVPNKERKITPINWLKGRRSFTAWCHKTKPALEKMFSYTKVVKVTEIETDKEGWRMPKTKRKNYRDSARIIA
jgi:hypothetical protein